MKGSACLVAVAAIVGGGSLGLAAPAVASPANTPGACHRVHIALNSHMSWWQTDCFLNEIVGNTGVPVHAGTSGGSRIVGHLSPGWQRFFRQRAGRWSNLARRADNVWAGTYASDGRWGFVNELWFSPASTVGGPIGCFANLPWHGSPPGDTCPA